MDSLINKINDATPRWLNEGIASYEAKDNNESWIKLTKLKFYNELCSSF